MTANPEQARLLSAVLAQPARLRLRRWPHARRRPHRTFPRRTLNRPRVQHSLRRLPPRHCSTRLWLPVPGLYLLPLEKKTIVTCRNASRYLPHLCLGVLAHSLAHSGTSYPANSSLVSDAFVGYGGGSSRSRNELRTTVLEEDESVEDVTAIFKRPVSLHASSSNTTSLGLSSGGLGSSLGSGFRGGFGGGSNGFDVSAKPSLSFGKSGGGV
ncbi:hypothetical protein BDV93DRAFT_566424 [Ceratobasidium sp. AG-I]|nr:hypothetical protein BDV93DRAFT_566424 [Ceratobasidium sp. AG-I]